LSRRNKIIRANDVGQTTLESGDSCWTHESRMFGPKQPHKLSSNL